MLKSVAEAFGSSGSVDRALKSRTIYVKNLFLEVLDFIREHAASDRFCPLSDPSVSNMWTDVGQHFADTVTVICSCVDDISAIECKHFDKAHWQKTWRDVIDSSASVATDIAEAKTEGQLELMKRKYENKFRMMNLSALRAEATKLEAVVTGSKKEEFVEVLVGLKMEAEHRKEEEKMARAAEAKKAALAEITRQYDAWAQDEQPDLFEVVQDAVGEAAVFNDLSQVVCEGDSGYVE
eukprot:13166576-Alexandrium_andersonii.AAC.1